VSEPAEGAEPASVLEPEDLQGGGDDHLLFLIVGRGNTLECLQPLQGQLPALSLVGRHSADSPADMGNGNYQGANSPADMGNGNYQGANSPADMGNGNYPWSDGGLQVDEAKQNSEGFGSNLKRCVIRWIGLKVVPGYRL
jgi:hypothetical protein